MRILFLSFAFLLASCSSGDVRDAAFVAVDEFHQQYNANDFDNIIAAADPAFRETSGEESLLTFFNSIREKFGAYQSSDDPDWNVNYNTAGNRVVLVYESQFEKGPVTEEFTFSFSGENVALYGYHVNSPLLLTE